MILLGLPRTWGALLSFETGYRDLEDRAVIQMTGMPPQVHVMPSALDSVNPTPVLIFDEPSRSSPVFSRWTHEAAVLKRKGRRELIGALFCR
jgi:hypothetical protein